MNMQDRNDGESWERKRKIKGINTVVEAPTGNKFEIQYYTSVSLEVIEKQHKLYEPARVLDIKSMEYKKL